MLIEQQAITLSNADRYNRAPWKISVTECFTLYKYIWNK